MVKCVVTEPRHGTMGGLAVKRDGTPYRTTV